MNRVTEQEMTELLERIQHLMDGSVNVNCNYGQYKVRLRGGQINPKAKYIAIDSFTQGPDGVSESGNGVFCFVAAEDNHSKAVGTVKKGDILKCATYKAPAKHARGSIYDDHKGMKGMAWTGPHYL